MQQTTRTRTQNSAGPLADAGPYDYDLPVAHGGAGRPAPVSQPAPRYSGETRKSGLVIFLISIAAPVLHEASRLPLLHCYALLYGAATVLAYWDTPQPRQGFVRWSLKVVGLFLNIFVALVTVPQSLRGLLPDSLAFALPAFAFVLVFYWVPPLMQKNSRTPTLWQWLLYAAGFAVIWGWLGPSLTG